MIKKVEKYLNHFLVASMTLLTSIILVGIPAILFYLIMREFLNKGRDLLLIAGLLSVITLIYFGIVHFKTKTFSNYGSPTTPKLLRHCAKVGSMLLYISLGLIFIQLSLYAYSAQFVHPFHFIPSTCSSTNRPHRRSEATLVFRAFVIFHRFYGNCER